ncbi:MULTISPECIES: effector-associated constant component EACC1 [Nocardia]|uniref:effector-associated constant component EACC1 n=1 Tax=Nocardia TaxID=1817 RepID=UPI000D693581|nr:MULTISPECIES: caspase family protein [Nocardia]
MREDNRMSNQNGQKPIQVSGNPSDLIQLRDWFGRDEALRGQVHLQTPPPQDGQMGGLADVLMVAFGAGGIGTVLVSSLKTWFTTRHSDLTLTVTLPNGAEVLLDGKRHKAGSDLRCPPEDDRLPEHRPMTRRRPDIDRSRAVLIGVSRYETDEQSTADLSEALPSLESVSANLSDLRQLLTEPDLGTFAPQHCTLVENPQLAEIGDVLVRAAREAEDVLLVYYSGHGLVDSRGRLYLGLPGSSQTRAAWKALPFETLREDLLDSPAKIRVLILDCCFSGRAFESMSDADTLQANQFRINGTFTLTSSAANEPSFAPLGEIHTAFTGALLSLARQTPGLTLDELYGAVRGHLSALGRPAPRRRSVDEAGDLVIFGHPHQSRSAAGIEVERFERTYEFDEARRVAPRVNPTSGLPGFWDVTVRNGSATPIAQLEADVYPVDATGSRIEDECVTAKGHRMLWKTLSDRNRAEVRGQCH